MTAAEMLAGLCESGAAAEKAAAALNSLLQQIAASQLREPYRPKERYFIEREEDREDVVSRVLIKILECSPLPVVGKSEGECRSYISTMVTRAWLSELRQRKRVVSRDPAKFDQVHSAKAGGLDPAEPSSATRVEDRQEIGVRHQLIRVAFEHLLETIAPRYRQAQETAWQQINAMVFEEWTIDELLARDEGIGPETTAELRKKAQARLLTAHSRLRKRLLATIETLEEAEHFTAEEAKEAKEGLKLLVRCQSTASDRILGRETDAESALPESEPS